MRAAMSSSAIAAALLVAAAPGTGSAQDWGAAGPRDFLTTYGEYVLVGGGVTNFTKDAARNQFDAGGAWEARLGFAGRYYVGGEVAYVGAVANGSGSGPDLQMNGVEGVVRVQVPWVTSGWLLEPFAFGGIGWSHLSLRNAPASVQGSDDVGVVPFGAGVTVGYGRLLLDARFTYRTGFDQNLALGPNQPTLDVDRWAVGASLGYEF